MNAGLYSNPRGPSFVSPVLPLLYTGAFAVAVNHPLGAVPSDMAWCIVCLLPDAGYGAGDEVQLQSGYAGSVMFTQWKNATKTGLAIEAMGLAFNIHNPTTFARTAITSGSWGLKVYLWR